jgi:curved DNA-binding protein CbpA
MDKNYYDLLEIEPTASASQLKAAYRKLSKRYHPDITDDINETRGDMFILINEAYQVLSNEDSRRRYDLELNFYEEYSEDEEPVSTVSEEAEAEDEEEEAVTESPVSGILGFIISLAGYFILYMACKYVASEIIGQPWIRFPMYFLLLIFYSSKNK